MPPNRNNRHKTTPSIINQQQGVTRRPTVHKYRRSEFSNQSLQSNQKEEISIQIQDNTGKPIEKFEINHEKEMHLIVVSKDLSTFQHLHPENRGKGLFTVTMTFPTGGDYKLIADFIPSGGEPKTESQWITVSGQAPSPRPLQRK
ncbi:hypothetical protein ACT91Q_10870 [Brevibacillus thermoruber]|uniref:hypothetical protein n=1 Tax=Brevibacillus thermoruber TaxID=33942 RepID=UPI0040424E66